MSYQVTKMIVLAALTPQLTQFTIHSARLQCSLHDEQKFIQVKAFEQIVKCPQFHGSNSSLYIAKRGQHDDWKFLIVGSNLLQHLQSTHFWQTQIKQDQVNIILIIDHEPNLPQQLARFLKKHNYDVSAVAVGEAGLQELQNNTIDLVMLDLA